jgi:hypothetical protein
MDLTTPLKRCKWRNSNALECARSNRCRVFSCDFPLIRSAAARLPGEHLAQLLDIAGGLVCEPLLRRELD